MAKLASYVVGEKLFRGRTKTEAREKAEALAARVFVRDWMPRILEDRGALLVMWRDLDEWVYTIQWAERREEGKVQRHLSVNSGGWDKEQCWTRGTSHLWQMVWTREDGDHVPDYITDEEEREFLLEYQQKPLTNV